MFTPTKKINLSDIHHYYRKKEPIVALTAYDALMSRLADEVGIHLILVGDSLGMTVLGYKHTLFVTLEQSLHHSAAVVRGVKQAMVIGDMPFLSFQVNPDESLRNAGRYLQEAGCDGVKLEGGKVIAGTIRRLVDSGIPVMGHIGLLPQKILLDGIYRKHGKSKEEAQALEDDARALEDAGVFAIVLEGIPDALSQKITQNLSIPTIGIAAGPHCSGQIQVMHDILGLFESFVPKHSKRYLNLAEEIRNAFKIYTNEVKNRDFPPDKSQRT